MSKPIILCVDDERIILTSLKNQLRNYFDNNYQIELAESGEEALEIIEECLESQIEISLVIADQIMGGMYGDELLAKVKELTPQTRSIMLTGQATAESVGQAVNKAGLFRYISKPWDEEDLVLTVETALQSYLDHKDLLLQESYQQALNQILQLVLTPIPVYDQLSQALTAALSPENFKGLSKGSIYIEDLESGETSLSDEALSSFVMIAERNQGRAPNLSALKKDVTELKLVLKDANNSDSHPCFQAPIILRDKVVGVLFVYAYSIDDDTPGARTFLTTVCHTLAGIIRLFQYNQALEKHSAHLEQQVTERTNELNKALLQLEQQNDSLKETNKELEYLASTDELTGLLNRRSFFDLANKEAVRANRYKRDTVMVMLDLDFFKHVNDNYGHEVGDLVLSQIAKVIASSTREPDIVGRVGGEEFAIVMPETNLNEGKELCERLGRAISDAKFTAENHTLNISASMGLSNVKPEELTIGKAMSRADSALYDAKHQGRNLISLN